MTDVPGRPPGGRGDLVAELEALRGDVAGSVRELREIRERQQLLQREVETARVTLAAIKSSNTWRALEMGRRLYVRLRGIRMSGRRALAARPRRRRVGVPDTVRTAPLGVNVAGYVAAESGLGEAARASLRALEALSIPFVLNNVPGPQRSLDTTYSQFVSDSPHAFNLVHLNADNMEAFAGRQGRAYFRDRYTIGFWFWELARFRADWWGAFAHVDEVWVATSFAQRAVGVRAPIPVVRMPLAVTPLRPAPAPVGRAHFGLPPDRFVFLFTFDVSSQIERKNPLAVVRAFRRSGLGRGRATLVLKFTNARFDPAAVARLQTEAEDLDVRMLDGVMDRGELLALMNAADCFVSLHRAEGFGLTMAEAMALGKPVIATAYSGNMDFMTPDSSCLVDYRLVPLTRDHGPYLRGFEWAEPDVAQAGRYMRQLVDEPNLAAELSARAPVEVARALGLDVAAARVESRLRAIQAGRLRPSDDGPADEEHAGSAGISAGEGR